MLTFGVSVSDNISVQPNSEQTIISVAPSWVRWFMLCRVLCDPHTWLLIVSIALNYANARHWAGDYVQNLVHVYDHWQ